MQVRNVVSGLAIIAALLETPLANATAPSRLERLALRASDMPGFHVTQNSDSSPSLPGEVAIHETNFERDGLKSRPSDTGFPLPKGLVEVESSLALFYSVQSLHASQLPGLGSAITPLKHLGSQTTAYAYVAGPIVWVTLTFQERLYGFDIVGGEVASVPPSRAEADVLGKITALGRIVDRRILAG